MTITVAAIGATTIALHYLYNKFMKNEKPKDKKKFGPSGSFSARSTMRERPRDYERDTREMEVLMDLQPEVPPHYLQERVPSDPMPVLAENDLYTPEQQRAILVGYEPEIRTTAGDGHDYTYFRNPDDGRKYNVNHAFHGMVRFYDKRVMIEMANGVVRVFTDDHRFAASTRVRVAPTENNCRPDSYESCTMQKTIDRVYRLGIDIETLFMRKLFMDPRSVRITRMLDFRYPIMRCIRPIFVGNLNYERAMSEMREWPPQDDEGRQLRFTQQLYHPNAAGRFLPGVANHESFGSKLPAPATWTLGYVAYEEYQRTSHLTRIVHLSCRCSGHGPRPGPVLIHATVFHKIRWCEICGDLPGYLHRLDRYSDRELGWSSDSDMYTTSSDDEFPSQHPTEGPYVMTEGVTNPTHVITRGTANMFGRPLPPPQQPEEER